MNNSRSDDQQPSLRIRRIAPAVVAWAAVDFIILRHIAGLTGAREPK
jgi:hypothetical protein